MVAFENENIRVQAVELWQEAFGDSEEYIRFFLENHSCCRCVTLAENGKLMSALYLIDGSLDGVEGCYLFAAATFKSFRSRGCMARLLEKAAAQVRDSGKSFIALVPAEKSLFDYYEKFGYQTAFYAKKHTDFADIPAGENRFVWCDSHLDYIRREHERFTTDIIEKGGEIYSVFNNAGERYIKVACDKLTENRYGMLLPLDEKAKRLTRLNSYIGLTLE